MKKTILILANKYPNIVEPTTNVFIQQLVWQFADMGYECLVACPMPINFNIKYFNIPFEETELTENGNLVKVYRPKYISMGQSGKLLQKKRVLFTTKTYEIAIEEVIKKMDKLPDLIYSHFICPTSVVASRLGLKYHIPAFMACGEALYSGDKKYGNKKLKKELAGIKGVVAVSNQNKKYLVDAEVVNSDIVGVFPNGYRKERFYPRDKLESRNRFNFPKNVFIVGMVGSFDNRKGALRIQQACEKLNDVYFACAGKGEKKPSGNKCLWAKPINNDELPWFYSALDVFVLPTTNEGCCNAIVEAIACGCPIISSDKAFNYDICDESNSILINPMDIDEIANSINFLKNNNDELKKLSQGSIKKSKNLDINQRAINIMKFVEEKCNKL